MLKAQYPRVQCLYCGLAACGKIKSGYASYGNPIVNEKLAR